MKSSIFNITAALALCSVSSGLIIPRDAPSDQNSTLSRYPNAPDFGSLNGTWFVTGTTSNVWDMYEKLVSSTGLDVGCIQSNVTSSSNITLDTIDSAFLNKTNVGVNVTSAGALFLQPPDSSVNISDHQYVWKLYESQVFANEAQWDNFTSNGQSQKNASESGSVAIPGSKAMEATIYSKLIDSNSQPGSNDSTNFDTLFLWGSQFNVLDGNQNSKRADDVYGVILSKSASINDDTFNKTLSFLPQNIFSGNVSVVKLNNTCSS